MDRLPTLWRLTQKGLKSILLACLIVAALERDIRHFRADLLADNPPMQALIRKLGLNVYVEHTANILEYEFSLPPLAPNWPT